MRYAFYLVWQVARSKVTAMLLASAISALLAIAIPWTGKQIIDHVAESSSHRLREDSNARAIHSVERWLVIEMALALLLLANERSIVFLRKRIALCLQTEISSMISRKALAARMSDFESPTFYDHLSRV